MGMEAKCNATWGKKTSLGTAQLETDYILFRGDFRLKVLFADLKEVEARAGTLRLQFEGGPASLQLGEAAPKWADKILRPPSRMQKLGVKPGMKVALRGKFEEAFTKELGPSLAKPDASDLIFLAAESKADLTKISTAVDEAPQASALWIIYPKGIERIREVDVIGEGRKAGLTDIKVVSFSPTHTGLKFVRSKKAATS
jgi:hypothetical protein